MAKKLSINTITAGDIKRRHLGGAGESGNIFVPFGFYFVHFQAKSI